MIDRYITPVLVVCSALVPFVLLVRGGIRGLRTLEPGKKRDVLIGAIGIVALNLGVYLAFSLWKGRFVPLSDLPTLLPWLLNLVPLLVLALVRRWIAIGALCVFGGLLAWAFLAGVLFYMSCLLVGALGMVTGSW